MLGIIGKKIGMSQIFNANGEIVPVTVIEAGPCPVIQVKTVENDGYAAIQVGFLPKPERLVNKPLMGHCKKAGQPPYRHLQEFRDVESAYCQAGSIIRAEVFKAGDKVFVTGISKGKGFQGVVRRHHFSGGPRTHGQSDRHRAPGSIGASAYPSRVIKGVRMAGQMGSERVTVRHLEIARVDPENNLIYIKGAVPGSKNSIVTIRRHVS